MTDFVLDKDKITKKILSIIETKIDYNTARKTWWKNIRSSGGLRLTDSGFSAFVHANIEFWEFEYNSIITTKVLLMLDKKLKTPFFMKSPFSLKKNLIIIFDSRIASIITLYGSIDKYLEIL